MMEQFGYFVTESSRHNSEYLPYFRRTPELMARFGLSIREVPDTPLRVRDWMKDTGVDDGNAPVGELRLSREFTTGIMEAMLTNVPYSFNGNVMNTGLITNLPDGCCVEVPCLVDARGVHPCYVGDLPPQLAALNRSNVAVQELAVYAVLNRDPGSRLPRLRARSADGGDPAAAQNPRACSTNCGQSKNRCSSGSIRITPGRCRKFARHNFRRTSMTRRRRTSTLTDDRATRSRSDNTHSRRGTDSLYPGRNCYTSSEFLAALTCSRCRRRRPFCCLAWGAGLLLDIHGIRWERLHSFSQAVTMWDQMGLFSQPEHPYTRQRDHGTNSRAPGTGAAAARRVDRRRGLQLLAGVVGPHLLHAEGRRSADERRRLAQPGADARRTCRAPAIKSSSTGASACTSKAGATRFTSMRSGLPGAARSYQEFERLKAQLEAEGLFAPERKRPLPAYPQRIGVVTSPTAAAFRDVLNVLTRRYPLAEVLACADVGAGRDRPTPDRRGAGGAQCA